MFIFSLAASLQLAIALGKNKTQKFYIVGTKILFLQIFQLPSAKAVVLVVT
jgi:hypothetical protein